MRSILSSLIVIFAIANTGAMKALQLREADAQATYNHIPAEMENLVCSDPSQQPDCKMYFAGFAHTLDLIFATDPRGDHGDGLCGDITDLIYEFAHEVQTNPKAHGTEMHSLLATVLIRDHNCSKLREQSRVQNHVSAGELIDMCHAGDTGFELCSQYQAGFLSAVLFISELTGKQILCGDQRLINPLSVARMLNEGTQVDFRVRRDSAVTVMLNELKTNMPCASK